MPLNRNPVGSTVFHANFIASVADTARIFYLKHFGVKVFFVKNDKLYFFNFSNNFALK